MAKVKIPKHLKSRLKEVGKENGFGSLDLFVDHLVDKGLGQYPYLSSNDPTKAQLDQVVDEQGYSSVEEVVEHLLERGLDAYGNSEGLDREKFEERLRGLGYIE